MKTSTALIALLSLTALAACDAYEPGDVAAGDEARVPLGKADHVEGSCAAVDDDGPACGGPAAVGNCWCDDACAEYGDCCSDAFDECSVGEPGPAVSQCLSDAQCDEGQTCAGGVCIADASPDCNDGTSLSQFCDIKPACADGQIAAIQNACFVCVDALTCEPPPAAPDCNDGTSLSPFCDIKPPCADGQIAAIQNACFVCVDALTCEPA